MYANMPNPGPFWSDKEGFLVMGYVVDMRI